MNAASPPPSPACIQFLDAHNHLQDEWLAPWRDKAIAQLNALPIAGAVVNGTCENDWAEVAALASQLPWARPSFGLHPWMVGNRSANWFEQLRGWVDRTPNAAVGEIGLDRWILDRARPDDVRLRGLTRASLDEQLAVFER